ncbi:unnamed protein product [Nesidiocoris tenuis]|uniref:Uncharacterized protein n=1 Tax=Nesidiocoris tenuis TaxID=355587 RepID=A0A6H5HTZ8_9HEMI|nr:unnamed protein product [Nesidiocoris tenuis]
MGLRLGGCGRGKFATTLGNRAEILGPVHRAIEFRRIHVVVSSGLGQIHLGSAPMIPVVTGSRRRRQRQPPHHPGSTPHHPTACHPHSGPLPPRLGSTPHRQPYTPVMTKQEMSRPFLVGNSERKFLRLLKRLKEALERAAPGGAGGTEDRRVSGDLMAKGVALSAAYAGLRGVFFLYSLSGQLDGIQAKRQVVEISQIAAAIILARRFTNRMQNKIPELTLEKSTENRTDMNLWSITGSPPVSHSSTTPKSSHPFQRNPQNMVRPFSQGVSPFSRPLERDQNSRPESSVWTARVSVGVNTDGHCRNCGATKSAESKGVQVGRSAFSPKSFETAERKSENVSEEFGGNPSGSPKHRSDAAVCRGAKKSETYNSDDTSSGSGLTNYSEKVIEMDLKVNYEAIALTDDELCLSSRVPNSPEFDASSLLINEREICGEFNESAEELSKSSAVSEHSKNPADGVYKATLMRLESPFLSPEKVDGPIDGLLEVIDSPQSVLPSKIRNVQVLMDVNLDEKGNIVKSPSNGDETMTLIIDEDTTDTARPSDNAGYSSGSGADWNVSPAEDSGRAADIDGLNKIKIRNPQTQTLNSTQKLNSQTKLTDSKTNFRILTLKLNSQTELTFKLNPRTHNYQKKKIICFINISASSTANRRAARRPKDLFHYRRIPTRRRTTGAAASRRWDRADSVSVARWTQRLDRVLEPPRERNPSSRVPHDCTARQAARLLPPAARPHDRGERHF